MPLQPITATGRACWASYLINGDDSGIDETERQEADRFAEYIGGSIVHCGDESFFARPDTGGLKGDCIEYTALIETE